MLIPAAVGLLWKFEKVNDVENRISYLSSNPDLDTKH